MMKPPCYYIWTVAGLAWLIVMTGCDTVGPTEAEPPELIPAEAFTVHTELFQKRRSGDARIDPNFMAAVMRLWPMSTTLDAYLQLPTRLTRAALDEDPTIEDGTWVWKGTVPVRGQSISFVLTGASMGDEVEWTLELVQATAEEKETASSTGPTSDSLDVDATLGTSEQTTSAPTGDPSSEDTTAAFPVEEDSTVKKTTTPTNGLPQSAAVAIQNADSTVVLYTARTDADGREGDWRLYDLIDGERTHVVSGTFTIEKENKREVTLSIPSTAPEHRGDSVVYARDGEQRRLRWVRAEAGHTHRITWNVQSQAGSITATNYNDGESACWGEQLNDVACAE